MRGRMVRPVVLAVLLLLLIPGSSVLAAGDQPGSDLPRAMTGITHIVNAGTAWVPELRTKFSQWKPFGWGTQAKVKAAGVGYQWVHIPLTYMSYFDGTPTKLTYVEFCAKSSNGALTKPVTMDVWDNEVRIHSDPITWPADNAFHCWGYDFGAGAWHSGVGISVQLYFANTTDTITLYKAWAEISP